MPYADPEKKKASDRARYWANRAQRSVANKKWRLANPDKVRSDNKRAYEENREARKAYQKQRYAKKKDHCLAWQAKYRKDNPEAVKAANKNWRINNRAHIRVQHIKYYQQPNFRMARILSCRIRKVLKGINKSAKTLDLLGCSIEFFRAYLEKQFKPGMTWENYGAWHVDHKRPCAKFDLTDPAQQRECFHYTNLQPLWALDNLRKGAR